MAFGKQSETFIREDYDSNKKRAYKNNVNWAIEYKIEMRSDKGFQATKLDDTLCLRRGSDVRNQTPDGSWREVPCAYLGLDEFKGSFPGTGARLMQLLCLSPGHPTH